jgi:hypothetical protein
MYHSTRRCEFSPWHNRKHRRETLLARNNLTFHGCAMCKANEQGGVKVSRLIYTANGARLPSDTFPNIFPKPRNLRISKDTRLKIR